MFAYLAGVRRFQFIGENVIAEKTVSRQKTHQVLRRFRTIARD
jgi:hypothetical protein